MKYIFFVILVLIVGVSVYVFSTPEQTPETPSVREKDTDMRVAVEVVEEGFEIPWDIAFLPEGGMLVTERTGHLILVYENEGTKEVPVTGVRQGGEGGLLGLLLHPDFQSNKLLYLYLSSPGTQGETENKIIRYRFENNTLTEDRVIISGIPGALYHDGGRMEFGPDGKLYVTTGDATRSQIAQDKNSLGGKILRLNDDGTIPADNPFGTEIYSFGHRNPQGLAWDDTGNLWETEHGRSGITSGLDEINLIKAGENYGWPTIEGDETQAKMHPPVRHSGTDDTWAPASLVYLDGSLFFGGLRGEALYEAKLEGERVVELHEHFKGVFGRIRTVRLGPDGMLYLTTSNTDGRGAAKEGDDKIIRVDPAQL